MFRTFRVVVLIVILALVLSFVIRNSFADMTPQEIEKAYVEQPNLMANFCDNTLELFLVEHQGEILYAFPHPKMSLRELIVASKSVLIKKHKILGTPNLTITAIGGPCDGGLPQH